MVDPVLYKDFITYDSKGQALMYVRINKAIYGMLKSALQFYLNFRFDIEAYGFKVEVIMIPSFEQVEEELFSFL